MQFVIAFSAVILLAGHLACKKLSDEVLSEVQMILHIVQLMPLQPHCLLLLTIQDSLTFLVPAYPGCTGKGAIKWMSVCLLLTV